MISGDKHYIFDHLSTKNQGSSMVQPEGGTIADRLTGQWGGGDGEVYMTLYNRTSGRLIE
jgi:hypothetical protein